MEKYWLELKRLTSIDTSWQEIARHHIITFSTTDPADQSDCFALNGYLFFYTHDAYLPSKVSIEHLDLNSESNSLSQFNYTGQEYLHWHCWVHPRERRRLGPGYEGPQQRVGGRINLVYIWNLSLSILAVMWGEKCRLNICVDCTVPLFKNRMYPDSKNTVLLYKNVGYLWVYFWNP